jgi:protocatechuate 3,4-dioxygenase beta subunit
MEVTMSEPVGYRRDSQDDHPPALYKGYKSTVLRSPKRPPIKINHTLTEITGPLFGHGKLQPGEDDLSIENGEEAQGQRIFVSGRVLDEDGRPVPRTLVEIWQCNAAGRYRHPIDQHPAPLDPNFVGQGRVVTSDEGEYKFTTIKPGAYPWGNHYNAWRPAHIHFSLFGPAFVTRVITQMYFPDDPLFSFDPIFNSIPDERARQRLVSKFDLDSTEPDFALSFKFNFIVRGRDAKPFEE